MMISERIINDIPGYTSTNDLLIIEKIISLLDKKDSLAVECGTFFGRSLSSILNYRNIGTEVHAIDNFRKSLDFDSTVSGILNRRCRISGSLEKFDKAMEVVQTSRDWQAGFNFLLSNRINEFKMYDVNSLDYNLQKKIDFVFLDTAHTQKHLMSELEKFGSDPETLLCGDDFFRLFPGVSAALNGYRDITKRRLVVYENTKIWALWPNTGYWVDKVNLI